MTTAGCSGSRLDLFQQRLAAAARVAEIDDWARVRKLLSALQA